MESAKPIEPGCKAIVLTGIGFGKRVDVGQFLGRSRCYPNQVESDIWEVEPDGWSLSNDVAREYREKRLMRIDDHDLQKQIESEREKVLVDV